MCPHFQIVSDAPGCRAYKCLILFVFICCVAKCTGLLVQQNVDGSDFFNRSWAEFKVGFNDTRGNLWLGNDLLHQLTTSGRYKLKSDLQATNGSWYYAEYSMFRVSNEASDYTIQVSGYLGNAGDSLWYNNGAMFSTYDRNNAYCAASRGGGFWHKSCTFCGVNVARGRSDDFRWRGRVGTRNTAISFYLQTTRMWLTC